MSEMKTTSLAAFASQLRAWRQQTGWTQVEAGDKLGYSASLVSGIETMDKTPTADFAARCDTVFGAPGTFAAIRELVAREVWPSYFAPVIDLEASAIRIHEWEMRVVPGLLQTEDYARSVITAGKPRDGSAAIDRAVAARLERQAILAREDPPMLWHVLHEGVLRHVVGGPAVMAAQLDKLAELATQPGIVIQVLPFSASDHPGTDGPILVYDFGGAASVAYTECKGGGRVVESADEVGDLMMIINMIRAAALPPRESASLIGKIRSEIADV
jgi:transcriptional regulator with XRE-family HTH domain